MAALFEQLEYEQLINWLQDMPMCIITASEVKGEIVPEKHCCPDFPCCVPILKWEQEKKKKYFEMWYLKKETEMNRVRLK